MGMGVMLSFAVSSGRLVGASSVSVAGGLRASPACSQHCHGAAALARPAAGALAAHLQHPRYKELCSSLERRRPEIAREGSRHIIHGS